MDHQKIDSGNRNFNVTGQCRCCKLQMQYDNSNVSCKRYIETSHSADITHTANDTNAPRRMEVT